MDYTGTKLCAILSTKKTWEIFWRLKQLNCCNTLIDLFFLLTELYSHERVPSDSCVEVKHFRWCSPKDWVFALVEKIAGTWIRTQINWSLINEGRRRREKSFANELTANRPGRKLLTGEDKHTRWDVKLEPAVSSTLPNVPHSVLPLSSFSASILNQEEQIR